MSHHLPPLNALKAFEAAARHLSFVRAAGELCVTQGAISRHILKLEDFLGVKLFIRRHRQVELTREGATYLWEIRSAFTRISEATASLGVLADEATLKVKLPPTCAIRWLVPRLARFHALHPEISVQVTTSHQPVSFGREDIDVAIQYKPKAERGLVVDRLFDEVLLPVCSGQVMAKGPAVAVPRDLERYVLLHSIQRPGDWPQWFEVAGLPGFAPPRELILENSSLTLEGAANGLGVAIAQVAFVADELTTGRLVAPIDIRLRSGEAYFVVFPKEKERLRKLRAFRDWLAEEISANQPH